MKKFRFDKQVGTHITHYESNFWLSRILQIENKNVQIFCMHLEAEGVIGAHAAQVEQLLLIIQGEGVVSGGSDQKKMKVSMGDAVFWETGEWHETKTEKGMTAIAIEGEGIDPGKFMKLGKGN
ncbi:cupin domain-containing protein [Oceanobacillus manasiensis]|uniref:cupin domain-containing protein n=1 Tax=Oceanobacillus manasiensis TaxID=586413 RepID=UPI0005AB157C|nr:cupin domain-containing protein [Oceanobacillus manasiensis]